jgi:hypothetical protein
MAKVAKNSQRGGSKPGERRGGRQKGTPNKATANIQEQLNALGFDPITAMVKIAKNNTNPVEVRARMCSELAQYVAPKRKAIEHSGAIENNHEAWLARLAAREASDRG